jgi:hypothetical protein
VTAHAHDDDRVAGYVAGTLSPDELEEFEQHLLTCEVCRSAVRLGTVARAALVGRAKDVRAIPRRRSIATRSWLAVAAAVVFAVLLMNRGPASAALGSVEPAPFAAGALRPSMDAITALVDSAMVAYQASDFASAAEKLSRAVRTDSSPAVRFFLGVSRLMRGDARGAVQSFHDLPLESPYAVEAAYYTAKALVRLEHRDSAIAVLDRAASTGPMAVRLRSFADSLRRR